MKQCHVTEEFILPEPVSIIEKTKASPLEFSQEENEVNLVRCQKKKFYDQKICGNLCSETLLLRSTRTYPISPCESICFQLTRSSDSAGDVCPTQKYCKNGCPCPFYKCEKFESRQKLIPVFDLRKSISSTTISQESKENIELITDRWTGRKIRKQGFPILLVDLNRQIGAKNINANGFLFSYERFS